MMSGNLLGATLRVVSEFGAVVTTFRDVGFSSGAYVSGVSGVYVVSGGDVVGDNLLNSLLFVVFRDRVRPVSFKSACELAGSPDVVGVFVDEGVARGELDRLLKLSAIKVAIDKLDARGVNDLAVIVQKITAGKF